MNVGASERAQEGTVDGERLAGMRAGNSAAFAALMRSNNQRLYRLARGFLGNDVEAEEAVHDGYVNAFTHLDGFRGGSSLSTWLARIVSNEALARLRRRRPTVGITEMAETLAADAGPFAAAEPTPERAIARREIRSAIEKAVDELPPYFRSVFMLRAVEQMSTEETASCLGIPAGLVPVLRAERECSVTAPHSQYRDCFASLAMTFKMAVIARRGATKQSRREAEARPIDWCR